MGWFYSKWAKDNSLHFTRRGLNVKPSLQGLGKRVYFANNQLNFYEWYWAGHQRTAFQRITVSWTAANKRTYSKINSQLLCEVSTHLVNYLLANPRSRFYMNLPLENTTITINGTNKTELNVISSTNDKRATCIAQGEDPCSKIFPALSDTPNSPLEVYFCKWRVVQY